MCFCGFVVFVWGYYLVETQDDCSLMANAFATFGALVVWLPFSFFERRPIFFVKCHNHFMRKKQTNFLFQLNGQTCGRLKRVISIYKCNTDIQI